MNITAWQVFGYTAAACGAVATVYLGYALLSFFLFKRALKNMERDFFGRRFDR